MTRGQIAYEAFREKALETGVGNVFSLPPWEGVPANGKVCWEAAGDAVARNTL